MNNNVHVLQHFLDSFQMHRSTKNVVCKTVQFRIESLSLRLVLDVSLATDHSFLLACTIIVLSCQNKLSREGNPNQILHK